MVAGDSLAAFDFDCLQLTRAFEQRREGHEFTRAARMELGRALAPEVGFQGRLRNRVLPYHPLVSVPP